MENAKPGHRVEFQGLKGAAHLNGTKGHLVRFLKKQKRWVVSCEGEEYQTVNAKPENLMRVDPEKVYYRHPLTGQVMIPKTTSKPVTDSSMMMNGGFLALHEAVLGAFYNQKKGGAVVSCGDNYMLAVEFDGGHGVGGVHGQMVYVDKNPLAQAVVRERGCERATELGRNFLAGETIYYIDTTDEDSFFTLLKMYKRRLSTQGYIDLKSGLKLFNVIITK